MNARAVFVYRGDCVDPETHRVYAPEQEADGKAVARMTVYEALVR
jgi:hypothetical protein